MSEENIRTLETYNQATDAYIGGTVSVTDGMQKLWIDRIFEGVPKSARVLEIGSATGRDAQYITSLGYKVDLSDASDGFVQHLRKAGHPAKYLNIVEKPPNGQYDMILAIAVFVHFTRADIELAMLNLAGALAPDGRLVFSVIPGQGEKWTTAKMGKERYFNYWSEGDIVEIVEAAGLTLVSRQTADYGDKIWARYEAGLQ